jgi:succinate dehydrogenase hydrophobic anchor subunit
MVVKSLGQLEEHAFFILFIALVVVLFWHGIWGLMDTVEQYAVNRLHIKKTVFNLATIILVLLIIGLFPQILLKF